MSDLIDPCGTAVDRAGDMVYSISEGRAIGLDEILGPLGDGVCIQDTNFRVLYQNRIHKELAGEHTGEYCYEAFCRIDHVCGDCPLVSVFEDGLVRRVEKRTALGNNAFVGITASALRDSSGRIVAGMKIVRDITERMKMEERLGQYQDRLERLVTKRTTKLSEGIKRLKSESRERQHFEKKLIAAKGQLESLIHNSADAIAITDTRKIVLHVNRAFEVLYGWTNTELVGNPLPIIPAELYPEYEALRKGVVEEGMVAVFEAVRMRKDGSRVDVSVTLSPIYGEGGRLVAIAGITRDITERKRMLRAAMESEERYRRLLQEFNALLDAIPDFLILLSADLKIIWANKSASFSLGVLSSGIIGRECHEIWMKQNTPCPQCHAIQSFSTGLPAGRRITTLDGKFRDATAFPIKDEKGVVINVIVVARDVTEKLQLEAEAMCSAHLASLGELAAGVAHEINNPINGIINYAQLLMDDGVDVKDICGRIVKEGNRVARIVGNLLSFARGKSEEKVRTLVGEILCDALDLADAKMRKDGIILKVNAPHCLHEVLTYPQQIQQVFLNVIHNARYTLNSKYPGTHPNKRLDIWCETVEEAETPSVRISFRDNGQGVPSHLLDKVFEPFFSTKPRGVGTGLGLSISKSIIRDHGGEMTIESSEGKYTRVSIELPAVEEV